MLKQNFRYRETNNESNNGIYSMDPLPKFSTDSASRAYGNCQILSSSPLMPYPYYINYDDNPCIIRKQFPGFVKYKQYLCVRYLQPPTPPPPSPIIVREVRPPIPAPLPPFLIRQEPPRPLTPPPLIIREPPPATLEKLNPAVIIKKLRTPSPPPRRLIIEKLPALPPKPRPIIIEKWLPYKHLMPKIIYKKAPPLQRREIRNLVVIWQQPNVKIIPKIYVAEVIKANPFEYEKRYKDNLLSVSSLKNMLAAVVQFDISELDSIFHHAARELI